MPLPSVEQYAGIIAKKDPSSLSTLTDHEFLFKETGFTKEYCFSIGTSAAVFKAIKNARTFAIRCFLRGELETFKRYEQLAAFLGAKELPWKVGFEFLENEMLIGGQYYPVVKMDWETGRPLNLFIDAHADNPVQLSRLQKKLVALSDNLEANGIGHGDLKYNNILVEQEGQDFILKLIDYDSMFIPAFRGRKNLETGSPGFQPLKRLSSHFSETIDRFSIWVMITTLEAVKVSPDIWKHMEQGGFNNEHSLFSASDFFNPGSSGIFQKLRNCHSSILDEYLDKLTAFSRASDLNTIEKPMVNRDTHIPGAHEKYIPASPPSPQHPEQWKRYEIEIKTIPSGRDVLVYGVKKGITPLRLSLLRKDFDHVEVVHEGERALVPVTESQTSFELDFSHKQRETIAPSIEKDEILEFRPDKYAIEEGELTTINWKVQGPGKIHIHPLGEVAEKTGTQRVVLNRTTDYVLTIGSQNRSFTIQVHPRPLPVMPQPAAAPAEYINPTTAPALPEKRSATSPPLLKLMIFLAFIAVVGLLVFHFTTRRNVSAGPPQPATVSSSPSTVFSTATVTKFLSGLYLSYNSRNLSSIMKHYGTSLNAYYDSGAMGRDSLSTVIKNLFIAPAFYNCKPDFSTLVVEQQGANCKATITIHEKLKNVANAPTENYNTRIEYILDPSFRIISEKSPS